MFTPEQRKAILERFRASGLKQHEFVAREGISQASLGKWLQKERRQAKAQLEQPQFKEVIVQKPGGEWPVEIVSPHNWTVRLGAGAASQALEQLLRSLPC